ncbi:MAG: tRNA pseudouridine(38-40) synthase TruA [Flavobacteriales bacterium]|nr:tRNA pseudouridine(38-40) synthase TruA [Flavobacteriales bacterium]
MNETEENLSKPEIMLPRYFLHISYDGTQYHGWQRQLTGNTVQAEMELALRKLLHMPTIVTTGCGRTDAGVHARKFYLHFDAEREIEDMETFFFRINQILPWDIAVHNVMKVHIKAHTRFDAFERSYEYCIHQTRDPFIQAYSSYIPFPIDVDKMNEAAAMLPLRKDFACFARTGGGQKTTICDLRHASWRHEGDRIYFNVTADRFLRSMVRSMVGTMLNVGKNKMTIAEFEEVLDKGERKLAGDSAKAKGLHLTNILYPYIINGKYEPIG